MGILTRRSFIGRGLFGLAGMSSLISAKPGVLYEGRKRLNKNDQLDEILSRLRKKKAGIETITYSVSRMPTYLNKIKKDDEKTGMLSVNVRATIYADLKKECLKTIILTSTPEKPGVFNSKITTIFRDLHEYQTIEALDESFKPSSVKRKMSPHQQSQLSSHLDDVIPVPSEAPLVYEKTETIEDDTVLVGTQDDSRYWLSMEKAAVLKKEIFQTGGLKRRSAEYRDFKEVLPGIQLPILVIDRHYDNNGIVIADFERKIINLEINVQLPPDCFKVDDVVYFE